MSIKEFDNILGIVAHYERCMCQGIIKAIDDRSLVMCDTCKTTSRVKNLKKNVNCIVRVDNESYSLKACLLYTSPSPRDGLLSRMPSSA